jgi:hypothetical protein
MLSEKVREFALETFTDEKYIESFSKLLELIN